MLPVYLRDQEEPVLRGPYYLLAYWTDGKTHSKRIRSEEAALAREGATNYKRLKELCEEFAAFTERLGELEREQAASAEAERKGLKSQSVEVNRIVATAFARKDHRVPAPQTVWHGVDRARG